MNSFFAFIREHVKQFKLALLITAILFILAGVFIDSTSLKAVGDDFALDGDCCSCKIYSDIVGSLFVIVGSLLLFALLFEKRSIKLTEMSVKKLKYVLALLVIVIFITLGIIAYFPFHNFPYSYDEYNYLYQANIFSRGKIFFDVPDRFKPFLEPYMVLNDNKLFSKYPPLFPLILSIGVILNIPGLINPLIATITLIMLYFFTKSFLGSKYGLLAVILMATTPYFLGYSASYFSQPLSLTLSVLILFLLRKYEMTFNDFYLYSLGLSSGFLFVTRPLDAFCVSVPVFLSAAFILYKNNNLKKAGYFIFAFSVIFVLFLTYKYILIGKLSIAAYPIVENEFKIVDPDTKGFFHNFKSIAVYYLRNGVRYIPYLLIKYLLIPAALFVPLFAIFGCARFKSKWKWIMLSHLLMLIFLYNFHPGKAWPQYGARYYYPGFASLVIFATITFKYLFEKIKNKNMIYSLIILVLMTHVSFSVIKI